MKQKLMQLFMKNSLSGNGGTNNYYLIIGLLLLSIGVYNIISYGVSTTKAIVSVYPFVIIGALYLTKIKHKVDIIIEIFLLIAVLSTSIVGEFSGIAFLIILLAQTTNKKQIIFIISLTIIGITINTIVFDHTIPQVFKSLFLVSIFLVKFYYKIYLATRRLHQRVKYLENELFRLGPAKPLTDDQIIQKYPFMYHPRENQYRRIEDVRMLADGLSVKEIASIAEVEPNTISREFDDLKVNIGVFIDTKIMSKEQLVKVCIELGIIEVSFIHR